MKKAYGSSEELKLPFSEAIEANDFVFISGQIHLDENGKLVEGTMKEKTKQVMENLKRILQLAKLDFSDVVKTEIYLPNIEDRTDVSDVYSSYLTHPYPARITVGVKELPLGADVEIAVVAVRKTTK